MTHQTLGISSRKIEEEPLEDKKLLFDAQCIAHFRRIVAIFE